MKLMMLAAAAFALAGCNRGQSASAQVLQRDAANFLSPAPTFKMDAGTIKLTPPVSDGGTMQLVPPTGQPPGTVPSPYPTGGASGTIPR